LSATSKILNLTSVTRLDVNKKIYIILIAMIPEVEELEELRKELGYSQSELAGQLRVPDRTYQDWVYQDNKPGYDNLKKIMKYLEDHKDKESVK